MHDTLKQILDYVNHWLRFAEAKNGALLAVDSGIVFGMLNFVLTKDTVPTWLQLYLCLATAAVGISAALSLISFVPKTRLPWLAPKTKPSEHDNMLFYGDIAGYDPKSFLESLYAKSGIECTHVSRLEEDYAEQIVVNSRIALLKYRLFAVAVWITVSALATPVVSLGLLIIRKVGERWRC